MGATITRRELTLGGAALAASAAFAQTPTPRLPAALRRGFNLPDQAPRRRGESAETDDLKRLRSRGMTHIRLPVAADSALPMFAGAAELGFTYDDVDAALERLLGLGFSVSVDMHSGPEFQTLLRAEPEKAFAALRAGWRRLAARIARWPTDTVFAELLNEPATEDAIWRPQAEILAGDLREILPRTTLIVGPAPYQRIEALTAWTPLADANIVYAAHYYDPMIFTHQGLTWEPSSPLAALEGVPFPLRASDFDAILAAAKRRGGAKTVAEVERARGQEATPASILSQFADLARWSATHKVGVIINEFGALRFKSRRRDRLAWLSAVRAACEAQGLGWAHWDYSGGFGLVNETGALDTDVLDALLPQS